MPTESTALLIEAMKGTGANAQTLQGNSPAGSADVGNPVKIGFRFNTTLPTYTNGQRGDAQMGSRGQLLVQLFEPTSASGYAGTPMNADAANSNIFALNTASYNLVWNGATWDRQRGDASGTFLAAATFWTESTAAQAAGATVNGTLRGNGGTAGGIGTRFNLFVAEAFADQAGTLYIDKSVDGGATWRQVASVAVTAGTSSQISTRISAASYRARFVNGASANTAFLLTTSYTLA